MAIRKTFQKLQQEKKAFCNIHNFTDLARTIVCPPRRLFNIIFSGRYKEFEIPKGKGKFRYIETPHLPLKEVQKELNRYLQAVYYFERTPAAYGFILNAIFEAPRNILTNAQQHLGKTYLLNIDLKSFFHQISSKMIFSLFQKHPFNFTKDIAAKLTRLTTYKQRLPMGSATSPVLSNFATRALDKALLNMAKQKEWTFTRYVDDLSFSSNHAIKIRDVNRIRRLIEHFHFKVNEDKIQLFQPQDTKVVTGLVVGSEEVSLPLNFIDETCQEITELKGAIAMACRYGKYANDWIDQLKRRVRGRINFIGFVQGRQDEQHQQLLHSFQEATTPPSDFVPVSWNDFSYCPPNACS